MDVFVFLSGGSLVGQNILFVLDESRALARKICLTSDSRAPMLSKFDEVYLVPETKGAFDIIEEQLLSVLKKNNVKMVFPCRDDDVVFLAYFKEKYPSYNEILPVGEYWISNCFLDKLSCAEMSFKGGIPYAPVCSSFEDDVRKFISLHDFPVVVKPKEGFASRGVSVVTSFEGLSPFFGNEKFVVQKFIGQKNNLEQVEKDIKSGRVPLFYSLEPPKISFQAFINLDGSLSDVFVTANTMRSGVSAVVERVENSSFDEQGIKWVTAMSDLGWRGPLNIQCALDHDGKPWVYEFNGRHTGATSARFALGFNEIGVSLKFSSGKDQDVYQIYPPAKTVFRLPVSSWADERIACALSKKSVWKKR
jgi:hypothetical protein